MKTSQNSEVRVQSSVRSPKSRLFLFAFILAVLCALGIALPSFGQSNSAASDMIDTAAGVATQVATPFIVTFAQAHPIVITILAVMGFLRFLFKPICAAVHAYVDSTETKSDDALYEKVSHSVAFKWVSFALDWLGSIKVARPVTPVEKK